MSSENDGRRFGKRAFERARCLLSRNTIAPRSNKRYPASRQKPARTRNSCIKRFWRQPPRPHPHNVRNSVGRLARRDADAERTGANRDRNAAGGQAGADSARTGPEGKIVPRPGVILDRDGTLIDLVRDEETGVISVAFHPDQLVFLPTVLDGLRKLESAGFVLAIATNQPGPAKGQVSRSAVERTNAALIEKLRDEGIRIARIEACLHHPTGGPGGDPSLIGPCYCRKPAPGMLESLIEKLDLDRRCSFMLGDSEADFRAACAAGLGSGLVFSQDRCELCPLRGGPPGSPNFHAPRFGDLAALLIEHAAHSIAGPPGSG